MDFRRIRDIRPDCGSSIRTPSVTAARATEVGAYLGRYCHRRNASRLGHGRPYWWNSGRLRRAQANDDLVRVFLRPLYGHNRVEPDLPYVRGSAIHYRPGDGERVEHRRNPAGRNLA